MVLQSLSKCGNDQVLQSVNVLLRDLHSHTTASDGTYCPSDVLVLARQAGVDMLAITDHDTTKGAVAVEALAKKLGIRLIMGVEISCQYSLPDGYGKKSVVDKTIHIVGLNLLDVAKMETTLQRIQCHRAERGKQMVEKLADLLSAQPKFVGLDFAVLWRLVLHKTGGEERAVGRAHIAQVLYELGVVKTVQQAFDKYLADNKPAFVALDGLTMSQAIDLIHDCGGKAVLAHPTRYHLSATRIRRLIADFAQMGGDACELPARTEPKSTRAMIDRTILANNLMVSVGSDFHGDTMPWRKLGAVADVGDGQRGVWTTFGD